MSSIRLEKISDFVRHGYLLKVDCRDCGRHVKLDPKELTAQCVERGWSRDVFSLGLRLRCSNCGGKNVLTGPAWGSD